MAKTLYAIIYDTRTLALRRRIFPDDDAQLSNGVHAPLSGETMIVVPLTGGTEVRHAIDAIRLSTGREPPSLEQIHAQGL